MRIESARGRSQSEPPAWPQPNRPLLVLVLVLERLRRLAEVEAGPDFKISGRTRCRPRNAFRIEDEDDDEDEDENDLVAPSALRAHD